MQTLQLDDATARKIYPTAIPEMKSILEKSFPAGFFSQKITDRVQGWSDILSISGRSASEYALRPGETADELAYRQAKLIAEVYNEGTVLDAGNESQWKYYPWHKITRDASKASGFGLSADDCDGWCSYVGVRLCFKSEILAIDAGKKFIEIYEQLKVR